MKVACKVMAKPMTREDKGGPMGVDADGARKEERRQRASKGKERTRERVPSWSRDGVKMRKERWKRQSARRKERQGPSYAQLLRASIVAKSHLARDPRRSKK